MIFGQSTLVGAGTKPLQNLALTTTSSMEPFQSPQREPLWVHSNQHLIAYYKFLQPLVRLCSRLIIIIFEYHFALLCEHVTHANVMQVIQL